MIIKRQVTVMADLTFYEHRLDLQAIRLLTSSNSQSDVE